jgi:hypothetical protein
LPLRHILLLLGLFAITLAIRWPNLGRPMSKHHEFCTATALRVLTVWHQEGIVSKGYNPATNFAGAADKYINNHASGSGQMVDAEGNYYYVSHPPLAYYIPYAVFSALHIEPNVLPLQYFNLFINLLCGLGIYLLARKLLPDSNWVGLLAATIYWFTPAILWFQSNVYMSDMMAQPFFIAALLLALYILDKPKASTAIGLAIVCFLGTYTTWFGVLVAGSLGLYFVFRAFSRPKYFWVVGLLMLSQVAALGLMAWQYSQIAGWDAYMAELSHRFGVRGGAPSSLLQFPLMILFNYFANYGALVVFIPLFFMVKLPNGSKLVAVLSLLPIVLTHVLLSNYTGHDFTTLYLAVPLSILISMLAVVRNQERTQKGMIILVLMVSIDSGFIFYTYVNRYGKLSLMGDSYDEVMLNGLEMGIQPKDAVIFSIGAATPPEALWYAKRNVKHVENEQEALEFLKERAINTGIIFEDDFIEGFQKTKTIYLQPNEP